MTVGLLAGVPTAAWADQKPANSVVSIQKYNLASYFDKGGSRNDNGNHWGRDRDNGNHWGWDHNHGDNGHHGDKSHGC